MYACPPKIPLVYEPEGKPPVVEKKEVRKSDKPAVDDVLRTIVGGFRRGSETFTVVDVDPPRWN